MLDTLAVVGLLGLDDEMPDYLNVILHFLNDYLLLVLIHMHLFLLYLVHMH